MVSERAGNSLEAGARTSINNNSSSSLIASETRWIIEIRNKITNNYTIESQACRKWFWGPVETIRGIPGIELQGIFSNLVKPLEIWSVLMRKSNSTSLGWSCSEPRIHNGDNCWWNFQILQQLPLASLSTGRGIGYLLLCLTDEIRRRGFWVGEELWYLSNWVHFLWLGTSWAITSFPTSDSSIDSTSIWVPLSNA